MDFSKIETEIDILIKLQDGWLRVSDSKDESPEDKDCTDLRSAGQETCKAPTIEAILYTEDLLHELYYYKKVLNEEVASLYPMAEPEGVQTEIDITKDITLTIEITNDLKDCSIWLVDTRDINKHSEYRFDANYWLKSTNEVALWLREELKKYTSLEQDALEQDV